MKKNGPSYSQKFDSPDNPSQNMWKKLKKKVELDETLKM